VHLVGGVDFILREELRGRELEDVHAAPDFGAVNGAVVPVDRPEAAQSLVGGDRPRSK
jgi:hypothetical protein